MPESFKRSIAELFNVDRDRCGKHADIGNCRVVPYDAEKESFLVGQRWGAHSVSATDRNEWVVLEHLTTETVQGDSTTELVSSRSNCEVAPYR